MPDAERHPWIERLKRVPVLLRIVLVVTAVPVAEYALLVWISRQIGFTLTLLLILGTGAVGTWFVRREGLAAWDRILDRVRRSEPVGEAIFDAALVLLAGVLLVMPGVLSDLAGFVLLIKRSRERIKNRLSRWLRERALMQVEAFRSGTSIRFRNVGPADDEPRDIPPLANAEAAATEGSISRNDVDLPEQTLSNS